MRAIQTVQATKRAIAGTPVHLEGSASIAEDLETAKGALHIWLHCLGDDYKVETMQPALLAISGILHVAWDADEELPAEWLFAMSVIDLINDALVKAMNGGPRPIVRYLRTTAQLTLELLDEVVLTAEAHHG